MYPNSGAWCRDLFSRTLKGSGDQGEMIDAHIPENIQCLAGTLSNLILFIAGVLE